MKDKIKEEIIRIFKESVVRNSLSPGRAKSLHVTQLVNKCMRRTFYDITQPKPPTEYKVQAIFRVGQALHEAIPLSDKNEVKMAANIFSMAPMRPDEINPINFFDCIVGSADDILEIEGVKVIVDKKSYSSKKNWNPSAPDDGYLEQLNIYKLLYFIHNKIDVKYGAILYMDTATRLESPLCFVVELDPVDKIAERVKKRLGILKSGLPPERSISWKCRFCPFAATICHPKEDPNYDKLVKQ